MGLREYVRKRKFQRTPEPSGRESSKKSTREHLFVIQKHAARRLHYDLRFEAGGGLKSWAVPKGLPLRKGEKHLAIHVEDHPLDYATFEGTIPKGNYGAGSVMVWDIGSYSVEGENFGKALQMGRIHFTLRGKKLRGDWSLVRMRYEAEREQWLVIKHGTDAKPLSDRQEDSSALSRRTMRTIANGSGSSRANARLSAESPETQKEAPHFIAPMKALLVKDAPKDDHWLREIKFDGMRVIAVKSGRNVHLFSRTHHDVTARFRSIAGAVRQLPCSTAVLDGEIVALDKEGRSSFQLLQPYIQAMHPDSTVPLFYYLFDLLHHQGQNLRDLPIENRKGLLKSVLMQANESIRLSDNLPGQIKTLLRGARRHGLEGLIAKRKGSAYEADRRSGTWIKLKTVQEQEFIIGAYTPPKGSRKYFGALLVGYYEKGRLRFASKVGTGFNEELLKSLQSRFEKLRRPTSPFFDLSISTKPDRSRTLSASELKRCTWLRPELICQVRFSEWTRDGGLRQPVFLGLREDKPPREVHREKLH